jgi:hypothetical protein
MLIGVPIIDAVPRRATLQPDPKRVYARSDMLLPKEMKLIALMAEPKRPTLRKDMALPSSDWWITDRL